MTEFIVMAIIFGILVGGFLGGMATAECRTLWGRILGIIIWIVVCGCSISGMIMAQNKAIEMRGIMELVLVVILGNLLIYNIMAIVVNYITTLVENAII